MWAAGGKRRGAGAMEAFDTTKVAVTLDAGDKAWVQVAEGAILPLRDIGTGVRDVARGINLLLIGAGTGLALWGLAQVIRACRANKKDA